MAPLLAISMAVSAELELAVEPAWNGFIRPGAATELRLTVRSPEPVQVTAHAGPEHAPAAAPETRVVTHAVTAALAARTPTRLVVPLIPSGAEVLLQLDHGGKRIDRRVALQPVAPRERLIALVDVPTIELAAPLVPVPMDARALPTRAASYGTIDALVIAAEALARLSGAQTRALQTYLAGCGAMVIRDGSRALIEAATARAGCGGARVTGIMAAGTLAAALDLVLRQAVPGAPPADALRPLLEVSELGRPGWSMVALLTAYLAFLLVGTRLRIPSLYLVVTPVAVAVLAMGLRFDGSASGSPETATGLAAPASPRASPAGAARPDGAAWILWAETDAGSPLATQRSIVALEGTKTGRRHVALAPTEADLRAISPGHYQILHDPAGGRAGLEFESRLLEPTLFSLSGTTATAPQLAWTLEDGRPAARNPHPTPSIPALLAWNDEKYLVPGLAPGARWHPGTQPLPWSDRPEERLFRARALRETAAVLIEDPMLVPSTWQNLLPRDGGRAYLMIRL